MTELGHDQNNTSASQSPSPEATTPARTPATKRVSVRCYYGANERALGNFTVEVRGLGLSGLSEYSSFAYTTRAGMSLIYATPVDGALTLTLHDYTEDAFSDLIARLLHCFTSEADTLNLIEMIKSLAEDRKKWHDYASRVQHLQVMYSPRHEFTYYVSTTSDTLQRNLRDFFDQHIAELAAEDQA